MTNISPGAVESELTDHIGVAEVNEGVKQFTDIAIGSDAIAQPADVDVREMIVRPSKQAL